MKLPLYRRVYQEYSSRHHKRLRTIIQELYGWVSSVDLHRQNHRGTIGVLLLEMVDLGVLQGVIPYWRTGIRTQIGYFEGSCFTVKPFTFEMYVMENQRCSSLVLYGLPLPLSIDPVWAESQVVDFEIHIFYLNQR